MHSVAYGFVYHYQIILRKAKSAKNVGVAQLISGSARVCDFYFSLEGKASAFLWPEGTLGVPRECKKSQVSQPPSLCRKTCYTAII